MSESQAGHVPVLADALLEHLALRPGAVVVDCTTGLGGHTCRLVEAVGDDGQVIGLDVDARNLEIAERRLATVAGRWTLRRANFTEIESVLDTLDVETVDAVVADLGPSSNQIDDPGRGFSFQTDGPLDMRLDDRDTTTAADLVNRLPETELANLIYENSQERFSRRIARRIHEARRSRRITRTLQLAQIVSAAIGVDPRSRKSRIHPATRTFLALRIAVNDEQDRLAALLASAANRLGRGGRVAVISFHSLEDRIVKKDFLRRHRDGAYTIETRKPITPSPDERKANPRSRSAKLRVARRNANSAEGDNPFVADTTVVTFEASPGNRRDR